MGTECYERITAGCHCSDVYDRTCAMVAELTHSDDELELQVHVNH